MFFLNSFLLGVGLACDAFSVSVANGLRYNRMRFPGALRIALFFALFQGLMPMIGWFLVSRLMSTLSFFNRLVPWIALILLVVIGIEAIRSGMRGEDDEVKGPSEPKLPLSRLIVQSIATSIDALSVGFTIADYGLARALVCAGIIAVTTLVICLAGVFIGKRFGTKFSGKAEIAGGIILILIGIEIFVKGMFF